MIQTTVDSLGNNPCGEILLGTPSDAGEWVYEASQPTLDSEQGSKTVRGIPGVPAILRVWAPDNRLEGSCKIETFAKGDGSHFFVVPTRIILHPGVRVEIEVDVE